MQNLAIQEGDSFLPEIDVVLGIVTKSKAKSTDKWQLVVEPEMVMNYMGGLYSRDGQMARAHFKADGNARTANFPYNKFSENIAQIIEGSLVLLARTDPSLRLFRPLSFPQPLFVVTDVNKNYLRPGQGNFCFVPDCQLEIGITTVVQADENKDLNLDHGYFIDLNAPDVLFKNRKLFVNLHENEDYEGLPLNRQELGNMIKGIQLGSHVVYARHFSKPHGTFGFAYGPVNPDNIVLSPKLSDRIQSIESHH